MNIATTSFEPWEESIFKPNRGAGKVPDLGLFVSDIEFYLADRRIVAVVEVQ